MRNRMLIVGIALMFVSSAAIAQGEGSGTEVPLSQPAAGAQTDSKDQVIHGLKVEATVAAQKAQAAEEALDAANAKLGVAAARIEAEQAKSAALQAAFDAKNKQRQTLRRLNTAEATRALATGRKAHWDEAKTSALQLDKLGAEIKSLEAEYLQMQEYLHNGGYFAEMQSAGFITRGQTDQLYAPKTPAVAPASPATVPEAPGRPNNPSSQASPPATSGKPNNTSSAAPTNKEESHMLLGILIGIGGLALLLGIIWVCYRAGLPALVAVLFGGMRTTAFYRKYDDIEITAGRGVVRVKGKKNP